MKQKEIKAFEDLVGSTVEKIVDSEDEIVFELDDGRKFKLWHPQDCCENVYVESIVGDLKDLINTPILKAEEGVESKTSYDDTETWTFYHLATINGYVTIRWYGLSNGYYSESVDFDQIN